MAEHIGISSVYLSNIFKKETGMNFVSYLTKYRLDKGKEMLLETSLSVKDISKYVGYHNASYFVSVFKGETGYSPVEYRQNMKENR